MRILVLFNPIASKLESRTGEEVSQKSLAIVGVVTALLSSGLVGAYWLRQRHHDQEDQNGADGHTESELIKRLTQGAFTGRLQMIDDDLKIAAALVQADPAAHDNQLTIAGLHAHRPIAVGEHGAADLGVFVF